MHYRLTLLIAAGSLLASGCSRQPRETAPEPARTTTRTTRPAATRTASTPSLASNATAFAEEVITRTNTARRGGKLAPLTKSVNLMRAAQIQASQMASTGVLAHDVPGTEHPSLGDRLKAVQYLMRAAGENIGEGYRSPSAAVAGWMASPGHRANIMSKNYTQIGTAMAVGPRGGVYWVQVFGRPR